MAENRFLALDPSSRELGVALFDGEGLTKAWRFWLAGNSYGERFTNLERFLDIWHRRYNFTELAYEGGSWGKFKVPALQTAIMTIRKWCEQNKIQFFVYAPTAIKRGVTGNYKASKEEVARVIYLQFPDLPQGISTHTTDAIAVGLVHLAWQRIKELEVKHGDKAKS